VSSGATTSFTIATTTGYQISSVTAAGTSPETYTTASSQRELHRGIFC
jgi:hypothetical protein